MFQVEQIFLGFHPAGKAGERAIAADHPVTGRDDRDRVAAIGGADSTGRGRAADGAGDVGITARLAERYVEQRGPDLALEIRALKMQRDGKMLPLTGEIFR